jgi:hypothetical protein
MGQEGCLNDDNCTRGKVLCGSGNLGEYSLFLQTHSMLELNSLCYYRGQERRHVKTPHQKTGHRTFTGRWEDGSYNLKYREGEGRGKNGGVDSQSWVK